MPNINDTIYPVLLKRYSDKALAFHFTPTASDIAFVKNQAKQSSTQCMLLIMLKVTQHLHWIPAPNIIPYPIIKFISSFFTEQVVKKEKLVQYESSGTFIRHTGIIRNYLVLNTDDNERQVFCLSKGIQVAETKDNLVDIINALIELMIQHQFELPAFSRLEKLARTCCSQANDQLYEILCKDLTADQIKHIESIYGKTTENKVSNWQRLKQEPDKPTISNIRDFLKHLQWLKSCAAPLPSLDILPVSKQERFRYEAMALHSSDMRVLKTSKRMALAITLVKMQWAQAVDDLVEMFIKQLNDIEQEGKHSYQADIYQTRDRADELITQFSQVLHTYQSTRSMEDTKQRLETIDAILAEQADDMLISCESHLSLNAYGDKPYVLKVFRRKRKLLFQMLEQLPLGGCTEYAPLLELGKKLLTLYVDTQADIISLDIHTNVMSRLPQGWLPLIEVKHQSNIKHPINRYALETAWFLAIGKQLKTFNCFVDGGQKYGDPNEQLISWDDYLELAKEYAELSGIPTEGKTLVLTLKKAFSDLANDIDTRFPDLKGVQLKGDELILQRTYTKYHSDTLEPLRNALSNRMPKVSIIDVITDTVRWLKLDELFKPHSGYEGKLEDHLLRLIVSLFCYGCNVGAQQTMDSIKNLSRKQIAWLNARLTTIKILEKAIKKAVDVYAQMGLPKQWGDGTHASADGTHRPMYDANILSEFHFRYRQKGAIGYYMVSDQYIALFSHFIACGAHESWHILDGIVRNEMAIQPTILHGDTHAQNYVIFGLAYLLGIKLMPRIRGIKHLKFFKPSAKVDYKHIKPLFSETIAWHTIEKGLPDMLRIVLSIRKGKITPSAILRRLNTYSDKNSLYKAFQELGKVGRTMYLLEIISDTELRKTVHSETNKSEQFNEFSSWLFFGNGGIIRHNDRFEQEKIIKYHHLVSTLMVLFNTHHMSKALEQLKLNGFPLCKNDISHLSPYHKFGTNLLGHYYPDLDKQLEPIRTEINL